MKTIQTIDRGGFGKVEEVELDNGIHVAKKIFDPQIQLSKDEHAKIKLRFEREVLVQSKLPDSIALPILEYDLKAVVPWYTMPLADKNYRKQITEDLLKNQISTEPIADLLNCLAELHSLGYIHRDLKPENILFHENKWKLADFGLVLPISETSRFTSSKSSWGTEQYMAPEQLYSFREVTTAADIFSVGCILHDLFSNTDRIPFQQLTCDGPIGPIIEHCTEINPNKRISDAGILRDLILTILSLSHEEPNEPIPSEWIKNLSDLTTWSVELFSSFIKFLHKIDFKSETAFNIYSSIDQNSIQTLYYLDLEDWEDLANFYFEWTNQDFNFTFCDVISSRLLSFFNLGKPNQKAGAIIAAARLAYMHNRWFVMKQVLTMAGPSLDNLTAQRLVTEIEFNKVHEEFITCALGIDSPIELFHPIIARVLNSFINKQKSDE